MIRRTIMIFPKFDNINVIDKIREEYDPIAKNVRPHITLAFTFESELRSDALKRHLEEVLAHFRTFKLNMGKIVEVNNALGKYLFLLIDEGLQEIKTISSELYSGVLEPYKPDWLTDETFLPHMTIGQFISDEELNQAYKNVKLIEEQFITTVDTISVEIIDENEDSIIDFEVRLK